MFYLPHTPPTPLQLLYFPFLILLFIFNFPQFFIPSFTICIIFPPQSWFPSSSTILLFSLLHLHLLIYSIYFNIHKYIDLLSTLHRRHIDPKWTPHGPYIDPTSIPHRLYIDPTLTSHRPYIDPSSTPHRPYTPRFLTQLHLEIPPQKKRSKRSLLHYYHGQAIYAKIRYSVSTTFVTGYRSRSN